MNHNVVHIGESNIELNFPYWLRPIDMKLVWTTDESGYEKALQTMNLFKKLTLFSKAYLHLPNG